MDRAGAHALLVGHTSDLLAVLDVDGVFRFTSPAYARRLGHPEGQLEGRSIYDLLHPADREAVLEAHLTVGSRAAPMTVIHRLLAADGRWEWVETSHALAVSDDAEPAIVTVSRPLDSRLKLRRALEARRDVAAEAAELEDLRAGLLTAVSHELRTPLTTAVGMARTLERHGEDLEPVQRRQLAHRLAAATASLQDRVFEAITAGQLLTRDLRAARRPVRLRGIVEDRARALLPERRPVEIAVDPAATVVADPDHVAQIVTVLLSNADKHAPAGQPITVRSDESVGGRILVVEDRGPGVPEHARQRIFEPFGQWRRHASRPGLGLGLYLVRGLAHLHGGRAWVEDRPGGGASFRVLLPTNATLADRVGAGGDPMDPMVEEIAEPVRGRPRILVVDDDRAVLETCRLAFELEGSTVVEASSGSDALAAIDRQAPDVVVLDVMMPDMDGWDLAGRIRARHPDAAIVFCTALAGDLARRRADDLGAVALVSKPFDPADLVAAVASATASSG